MTSHLSEEEGVQVVQRLMLAILNTVLISRNVGIPESMIRNTFLQRGMDEANYNFLLFSLLEKKMLVKDGASCLTITSQGVAFAQQLAHMRATKEIPDPPPITLH